MLVQGHKYAHHYNTRILTKNYVDKRGSHFPHRSLSSFHFNASAKKSSSIKQTKAKSIFLPLWLLLSACSLLEDEAIGALWMWSASKVQIGNEKQMEKLLLFNSLEKKKCEANKKIIELFRRWRFDSCKVFLFPSRSWAKTKKQFLLSLYWMLKGRQQRVEKTY